MWSKINYFFVLPILFFVRAASVPHALRQQQAFGYAEDSIRNPNIQFSDISQLVPQSVPTDISPFSYLREPIQNNGASNPGQIMNNFRPIDTISVQSINEGKDEYPVVGRQRENRNMRPFEVLARAHSTNPTSTANEDESLRSLLRSANLESVHNLEQPIQWNERLPMNVQPTNKESYAVDPILRVSPGSFVNYPGNYNRYLTAPTINRENIKSNGAVYWGQPLYTPIVNIQATPQNHNVQEILSNQRIRDVLSASKHQKRYLVIHPNGTVEHIDSLESISNNHPNFVLVNAGHVSNTSKPENAVNTQTTAPTAAVTVEPEISNTETEICEPQIAESNISTVVSPPETVETVKQQSPEPILPQETISSVTVMEPEAISQPEVFTNVQITPIPSSVDTVEEGSKVNTQVTSSNIDEINIEDTVTPDCNTSNSNASNVENNKEENEVFENNKEENEVVAEAEAGSFTTEDSNVEQNKHIGNENVEIKRVLFKGTEEIDVNSQAKPISWFSTTEEDFWDKLSNGQDDTVTYFFFVTSQPRIERDTTRTVYPDGKILEETTESIWYNEDDPTPVVTKTSRLIHPDESS